MEWSGVSGQSSRRSRNRQRIGQAMKDTGPLVSERIT